MKVYIWGTGTIASEYLKMEEIERDNILGFIETERSKSVFMDKKVYEPSEIAKKKDYDYILVCVYYYGKSIYNICKNLNIDTNKLVLIDNWEWSDGTLRKGLMRIAVEKLIKIISKFKKYFLYYIKCTQRKLIFKQGVI